MTPLTHFKNSFDGYVKTVFQVEDDIRFWKSFLTNSIEKYKIDNPINKWISQSGFSIYNYQPDDQNTWLYTSKETLTIEVDDLKNHSNNFFVWVMNLSLIRLYNSTELLILQTIGHKYYPTLEDPINGKKHTNKIIEEIKTFLKTNGYQIDSKNNRYLITFLKAKSQDFSLFCNNRVNKNNWNTKWENFFELISILRNIITHHAMIVTQNVRNELNSVGGELFTYYFDQPLNNRAAEILRPKNEQLFLNFMSHVNDFNGNTVKFIAGESDLQFLGLYP